MTKYCKKTDTGLTRKNNEDYLLAVTDESNEANIRFLGKLFAVADGMGGHPGGDVASRMVCQEFRNYYYSLSPVVASVYRLCTSIMPNAARYIFARHMSAAFHRAHRALGQFEEGHKKCKGLGTTLSVMVLLNDMVFIAHIGDSRIYRFRKGMLELLTMDHTLVQEMVDSGEITRQEAEKSPMRHVLRHALGHTYEQVFTRAEKIRAGDTYLLCSDGLHDMTDDGTITEILGSEVPVEEKCDKLVKIALEAGGRDNVTVITVQI